MSKNKITDTDKKSINELKEYLKNPDIGVEEDTLIAFIGKNPQTRITWKIRPDGWTKIIRDQIRLIAKNFKVEMKKLENQKEDSVYEQEDLYEKSTKQILELGLIGFDYEKSANDVKAGPSALGLLANEVRVFLVEHPQVVSKHLQMLSKLESLTASSGSTV